MQARAVVALLQLCCCGTCAAGRQPQGGARSDACGVNIWAAPYVVQLLLKPLANRVVSCKPGGLGVVVNLSCRVVPQWQDMCA
jgi:hypothetical protein